jgi:hypothetical protein
MQKQQKTEKSASSGELSDGELEGVAGGSMIATILGTTVPVQSSHGKQSSSTTQNSHAANGCWDMMLNRNS